MPGIQKPINRMNGAVKRYNVSDSGGLLVDNDFRVDEIVFRMPVVLMFVLAGDFFRESYPLAGYNCVERVVWEQADQCQVAS